MLEVRLLGQFDVRLDGKPVAIPSRSAQSLFAYLILNAGTAHRREKLAGLLWPETTEEKARDNLRHALWRLRKALAAAYPGARQYILTDEISIAFDAQSGYWLDTSILECGASEHATAADLIGLLALYHGDLLPGFYDDWVILEREQLQALFEQETHRLLAILVNEQRWADVLDWGERWIAFGHTPEPAYRALMVAHNAQGDLPKVVAAFERCRQALHDTLGVEPSEQTRALFNQLSRGETIPRTARRDERISDQARQVAAGQSPSTLSLPLFLTTSHAPSVAAVPFVARERELDQLNKYLSAALAGQGQLALVSGESGSGKTLLAHEFARRAQAAYANLVVASGTCNAYTGIGDPYLPFREILSLLTGDVESQLTSGIITQENASRLQALTSAARLALIDHGPDLIDTFVSSVALKSQTAKTLSGGTHWPVRSEKLPAQPIRSARDTALDQTRIFEQYTNVLRAMAEQRPLLLIVDDLHWADVSSVGLLFHLSRRIENSRILIVGAYRPEDVTRDETDRLHPLKGVLNEFKRYFGDIWVDLDRISTLEGRHFVDALLDTERNRLGETFRRALFERTEGHALFTTELLHNFQHHGDLRRDETGQWVEGTVLNWDTLPTRVEGVIGKRIGRLSAKLRQALLVASVEGEEFTAEIVARVQGLDEHDLIRELSGELDREEYLVNAQRLHSVGAQRLSLYRFRHNLFQKYLYHTLDEVERAHLHAKVGSSMETLYSDQKEQVAVQLAHHFQRAGNASRAVDYLLLAGKRALQLSANEEAIGHFHLGLALLKMLPDSHACAQRELDLQIPLGNALIASKGHAAPEVVDAFTRARELCQELGNGPELWMVMHGLFRYFLTLGRAQPARELAKQILDLAQTSARPDQITTAYEELALTFFFSGEFAAALSHFDKSLAFYDPQLHTIYDALGEDTGATALCYSALAAWLLGYPDQASSRCQQALSIVQDLSHPYSSAAVLIYLSMFYQFRGEAHATQAQAEAALALSGRYGFTYWSAAGTILQGWALVKQGQAPVGLARIHQGLSAWQAMDVEVGRTYFLALLAEAHCEMGHAGEGLQVVQEALTRGSSVDRWIEAELYRLRGELLFQLNVPQTEVEDSFRRAIDIARRQNAKAIELRAAIDLSRLWLQAGRTLEARQTLAEIYDWFSKGLDTADLAEARALLGALA
jgi:DNA-binding SARP family transcriptional activator/predicted ATPase